MLQYAVLLGAAANLLGSVAYIRDTFYGTTRPNRVSWLLWSVIPLIAAFAGIADGVTWAVIPVFMSGIVPLIIFLSSFANPNAHWRLARLDYVCGALAVAAIALWLITDEPLVAIVLAVAADLLAGIPTLYKAWKYPETETGIAFITGAFSGLTAFAALNTGAPAEYIFPAYLVLFCGTTALGIYRKRLLAILHI